MSASGRWSREPPGNRGLVSADEPVTLIAVARAAGVSKTTASDALRNSGRVSEATRALVAETAIRLGYAPNPSARSLRMATTGAIGLHLPDNLTRSEYYMSFAFGAVEQAARLNYNVTLIMSQQLSETAAFLPVDGVILADPLETDPVVHRLMSSRVPVVTCERLTGPASPDGVLRSDHAPMFEELLARLHAGGARRPALLASSAAGDWGASLQAAFRRWCRGNGIPTLLRELPFGTRPKTSRSTCGSCSKTTRTWTRCCARRRAGPPSPGGTGRCCRATPR
ncbi:LacI family DNA-binding transcriptional regulator [Saccharopolyspora shandongensis]|uniref:LacI family DNA-binding transcriptional regulator n=1 Tax=Saccharopolyspora shandongensis TaxID=418495 RepID=UPI0033DB5C87